MSNKKQDRSEFVKDLPRKEDGDIDIEKVLEMADNDAKFTISDILAMGNPRNKEGWTIGHLMALCGHKFTPDEVLALGNPIADLECDSHWSIGAVMVWRKKRFSPEDKAKMGIVSQY